VFGRPVPIRTRIKPSTQTKHSARAARPHPHRFALALQWIDGAEAQGHAAVFVAKFFGRAGLMSFVTAVSEP
jgi:hypothetical protein